MTNITCNSKSFLIRIHLQIFWGIFVIFPSVAEESEREVKVNMEEKEVKGEKVKGSMEKVEEEKGVKENIEKIMDDGVKEGPIRGSL